MWLSTWAFFHSLSHVPSDGGHMPGCELPSGEAHVAGQWGWVWLTANGKLIASVQQSIKDCILAIPWKRVWKWLSAKPLDETATQTNTLTEALWGSLRQRHPADLQSDSWLIEMEKTNDYCVKPLSFGVILFMAFSVSLSLNLTLSSITLPPPPPIYILVT